MVVDVEAGIRTMPFSIAPFAISRLGMTNRRQILASIAAASSGTLLGMLSRPARAQTIQKLTRIIIGTPPGGYPDTVARLLINHMKSYASTIILENKPGAGQRIALEALKNSAADGSTMMLSPAGPNVLYPHIYKTLSYKPFEDFIPVTTVFDTPSALVVGPMVPPQVKTVADFVGWCRANSTNRPTERRAQVRRCTFWALCWQLRVVSPICTFLTRVQAQRRRTC